MVSFDEIVSSELFTTSKYLSLKIYKYKQKTRGKHPGRENFLKKYVTTETLLGYQK